MSVATYAKDWKPWVTFAAQKTWNKFSKTSVGTYPGHDPNISLAIDFMIPAWGTQDGIDYGNDVAEYLWKHRVEFGIWYVIWRGRIISMTRPSEGWKKYFDANNPNPSRAHKNHVHVSFYNKKSPGYVASLKDVSEKPVEAPVTPVEVPTVPVGTPTYPKPSDRLVYVSKLHKGQKDSDSVYWVQKALGVTADGDYGPGTVKAASEFQKALGDDVDGELGMLQTKALFAKHKSMKIKVLDKP